MYLTFLNTFFTLGLQCYWFLNILKRFFPFYIFSEFYNLIYALYFCRYCFFTLKNLHLKCKNNTSMSPPPCLLKLLIVKSIVNENLLRIT